MANTPVRQYIGSRYVPLFADPAEWDNKRTYEPLTIVIHNGNSYTSRQYVPSGIDITNNEFWANTGNYNAQVEQYRREVAQYNTNLNAKLETVAHDNTLAGTGTTTDPLKISNNIKKMLYTNVVAEGVDNSGATDVTEILQNIVNNAEYGVYFPSGIYKISKTINFPYNTNYDYGITLANGANIIATAKMTDMFYLGSINKNGTVFEGQRISGGIFNGNKLAENAIHLSKNIRSSFISGVEIRNFTKIGIYVDSNPSISSDTIITDCRIGRVSTFNVLQNTIGVYFAGYDNQIANCYITDAQTLIKTEGIITITNCHLFNQKQWYLNNWDTIGIESENDILFNTLYIDSCHIGIRCKERLTGSSLFIFNYFEDDTRIGIQSPIHQPGYININNYTTGINIPPSILVQKTNDNWIEDIHGAYNISVKMAKNQYPTSYKDALAVYGSSSAYPTLKLQDVQHNVPAKTGYIIGYMAKTNEYNSSARVQICTPSGYDFCFDGIINSTAGTLRIADIIKNQNYALAAGTEQIVPEISSTIKVVPIYLYNNKNETAEYFPELNITFYSGYNNVGWWKYTKEPTPIKLTTDIITTTTNNDNVI